MTTVIMEFLTRIMDRSIIDLQMNYTYYTYFIIISIYYARYKVINVKSFLLYTAIMTDYIVQLTYECLLYELIHKVQTYYQAQII